MEVAYPIYIPAQAAITARAAGGLGPLTSVHGALVIRTGDTPTDSALLSLAGDLGEVSHHPQGTIVDVADFGDYSPFLFTRGSVPMHWDGALGKVTPRYVILACAAAPARGGATILAGGRGTWETLPAKTQAAWRGLDLIYDALDLPAPVTHPLVAPHPVTGAETLRIVAPRRRDTLGGGGASVDVMGRDRAQSERLVAAILRALRGAPGYYEHAWAPGDILVLDNHAVLHGRRAFPPGAGRVVRRVHIL